MNDPDTYQEIKVFQQEVTAQQFELSRHVFDSVTVETDDGDILLDYSKNLINQEVMALLLAMVTHTPTSYPHSLTLPNWN